MTDQPPQAVDIHRLEAQRRENRDKVIELGLDPYGGRADGLIALARAAALHSPDADAHHQEHSKDEGYEDRRPTARVAGRVVLHRDTGKLVFMNLRDESRDSFQIAVSKRDCDELGFKIAKLTDLGDLLVVEGPIMKTRTGEITIWASRVEPASKCLIQPPEKHAGLTDPEARYRQRYVDMWATPDTLRVFQLRSKLVAHMRRFLDGRGFLEVETPMLQTMAGGAAARPFETHMNALDIPLSLRIAPELYLKRLLVGGLGRVYEVNRNFRNEGIDKQHNPEFTALEVYQAFGDYQTMAELTESLLRELASTAAAFWAEHDDARSADNLTLPFGDLAIDYAKPFDRVTYAELFERSLGFAMTDLDKVWAAAEQRHLTNKYAKHLAGEGHTIDAASLRGKVDDWLIVNALFEEVAEESIDPARPTFVFDYPAALSPLTRPSKDNPELAERWDLFIAGMEIGPAYTELNDPDIQEAKFREQLAGLDDEESTFRSFDRDFVRALKVGMPPAGGLGLGVDRIAMLMTGARSIRDVIFFPLMRPEAEEVVRP